MNFIEWDTLLKNRKPMASLRNSAHMLECMEKVQARYPMAVIEEAGPGNWRIVSEGQPLSNPHHAHYACWIEAREALDDAN